MAPKWQFKRIQTRQAIWFLVVALTPLFAAITILYYQRSSDVKVREFEKLQIIRDLKDRELNNWIDERLGDMKVAAGDHEIRGLSHSFMTDKENWTQEDTAAIQTGQELCLRLAKNYSSYRKVFIINSRSGEILVSSDAIHHNPLVREEAYFTEVLRTKETYIQDIYYSKIDGNPTMAFSSPVFSLGHDDEQLFGVLVAEIDLEQSLYPMLQENTGYGDTGETLIVNTDAVALNDLRWHNNAPLNLKISAKPATMAANGETGIAETPDYRGKMVLAAYTYVPRTRWGFVAKRDLSEIYSPIRAMVRDIAIMLAVSAFIVLMAALTLSRFVAKPILAIASAARRVREGDLTSRCEVEGSDELADLARSFNEMAETVSSQLEIKEAGSKIANTLVTSTNTHEFASNLVVKLMQLTESNIGAFYMRDASGLTFSPITSIGMKTDALERFDSKNKEGEFGKAIASGLISYTANISAETVFTFKTVAGTAMPGEIVTIPLLVDSKVQGIVSLATLSAYTKDHRAILDQSWVNLHTALSSLLASEDTLRLAQELQSINEELQATNEELHSQTEELQSQAEELEQQTVKLEIQRKKVEDSDRLKSEFLSNMSHELRTPLNSVLSLSQLLLSRGTGKNTEQESEYLQVIERNGRQLLDLINDILDLSKIEAGNQDVSPENVNPSTIAQTALATVKPLAEEKGLKTTLQAPNDLPVLYSDRGKTRQILINILSNAVKFTETGGIDLKVSKTTDGIIYTVTDTGPGMSPDEISQIFNEFCQLDGSSTRKHGGTGLGLSISRKLARILGGDVTVSSEPGKGSTFVLSLPLRYSPLSTSDLESGKEKKPAIGKSQRTASTNNPRILLVEDNDIAVIQIQNILETGNCEVTVATSGAKGLEIVRELEPDAMILDLMMPDMDGFSVLKQLRSIPETKDLPVMVLTAKELTESERNVLKRNNVSDFIQKGSLAREELFERILGLIATSEIPEPTQHVSVVSAASVDLKNSTILVVEDNSDSTLAITAMLEDMGARYVTAQDGESAVRMATKVKPDLILMDIQLPLMSGFDATRMIKNDSGLKHIPIIALSARAMVGDREEILAAGCSDYLSKPIDQKLLRETIQKWLA